MPQRRAHILARFEPFPTACLHGILVIEPFPTAYVRGILVIEPFPTACVRGILVIEPFPTACVRARVIGCRWQILGRITCTHTPQRRAYDHIALHRWPYCTGGHIAREAILYRWPNFTGGHIAQWPHCTGWLHCATFLKGLATNLKLTTIWMAGKMYSSYLHACMSAQTCTRTRVQARVGACATYR